MHLRSATRSLDAWPAPPLGGIRQHEQVPTGDQLQGERGQRRKAYPDGIFLVPHGNDVDDDACCKGNGQPAMGLPNPLVPVQWDLLVMVPINFRTRDE